VPDPDRGASALERRPLLINTRRNGDSAAIALSGELDLAADELDAVICEVEETDVGRIVVDLSGVSFIDSTGLSALMSAKKRSPRRLKYIPSNHDSVTRLLELTGVIAMLR
jgi:anti-sigma B factor antagonist